MPEKAVASLEPRVKTTTPRAMLAAVVTAPGRLEIREVPLPKPGPAEVRVRVAGCGVCASNIPPWEGREWFNYPMMPGALGHEGWGTVDAAGDEVRGFEIGDPVALLSQRAYAQFDVAPPENVVRLPPSLKDIPFPGEPLGCAMNIFGRSAIAAGQTVAIVGIGFLGALLTQLASKAGARVIAIARRDEGRDLARRMGAGKTIRHDQTWQVVQEVEALTSGKFCPVVIECTGKQEPLDLAGQLTSERGRLVIAGYHQDGLRQVNLQLWNWRGIDVINAHERDPAIYVDGIKRAVAAVAEGAMNPAPLYSHRLPLESLSEALELTRTRPAGFSKALIEMPQ